MPLPSDASSLDQVTIGDARRLASLFSPGVNGPASTPTPATDEGWAIVIADRGFVWVGQVTRSGDTLDIRDGSQVRYWGTTRGLGELTAGGPTNKTKLDPVAHVRVPIRAVIAILPSERALWTR